MFKKPLAGNCLRRASLDGVRLGAGWALVGTIQSFRLGRSGAAKALLGLMLLASLGAAGAIPVHAYVLSNNAAAQQSNLP